MAGTIDKAKIPQMLQKILPRKHITEILDNASLDEAAYIVAPYGCGKTVAVLSWIRERGRQPAWITLDKTDNAEASFIESLTAALLPFAGEQGDIDFLSNPQCVGDTRAFLLNIASRMAENTISADILVIDNFHFISDFGLLRDIKDFIGSLLGHLRIIIISRAELSPIFNDLMLKRHICLITIRELSFCAAEISKYFAMNGYQLTSPSVERIYGETEGWPAALNVILTVSRGSPIEYGEDARAYVKGFFDMEIWEGMDDNVKDFLLRTSVLDKLTPTACRALTGIGAALPVLTGLFTNGLFISKLEKDTYQYHRVFSDFLRDKLESSGIKARELYEKAAWWYFERDEFEQSFIYFFKAGDLYGINQIFHVLNPANMGIEGFLDLTSCITSFNAEDLKPYPVILTRIALIQYLLGNIDEMQRLYAIFREWMEPGELPVSPEEFGEYIWEVGWLSYLDPNEAVLRNKSHEEWTNYKEYIQDIKPLHTLRFSVLRFPSALRGIRDYCTAVDSIDAFIEQNEASGRSAIRDEYALFEMELISAEYAYETENYQKAEQTLRRIMPLIEAHKITSLYFVCTTLLVKLTRAIHDSKEADALTERLEKIIIENGETFLLPNFHAFQQRNWLLSGNIGFTGVFERENKDYANKPYFYLLYRHIAYVRGLLSVGSFNEALLILCNLDILCRKYRRTMDRMEVSVLRAIALYGLGDEASSCQNLIEALNEARKYGFIRIFSDDAKYIRPILELVRKQMNDTYVKNIIISCKKVLTRSGIKLSERRYELTKAELKILKCLQTDMSYEEIALDNGIRISTVKSHAHSIYSKLQVDNRIAAVFAARHAGILD